MNIKNSHGLSFDFLEDGFLQNIEVKPIRIGIRSATIFSHSGANIYLRKRSKAIEYKALLGSSTDSYISFLEDSLIVMGKWAGLEYTCILQLSKKCCSWFWTIEVHNISHEPVELDLILLQDVGLKPVSDGLINEYYISQYIERRILEDKNYGSVICCRQNMAESTGNSWLILACMDQASSASVDGLQFYGRRYRETGVPEGLLREKLGGEYSGESSVVALQANKFNLESGQKHKTSFLLSYLQDHPTATSDEDLKRLTGLIDEFDKSPVINEALQPVSADKNIFLSSPLLPIEDLNELELNKFFETERRHSETGDGKLLSFFSKQNNYIALREKEILADRPHGHIMQAQTGYLADENIVSTTCFAFGVFNSHLTQGNTNFNILLSICSSQFNQIRESGQRIFVEMEGQHYLLGVPSAFEIGLNHCRWIYKHGKYCFQVRSWTSKTSPTVYLDFKVLNGSKIRLTVTHNFDQSNGWQVNTGNNTGEFIVKPKKESMIARTFPKARFRMNIHSRFDYKAGGIELLNARNSDRTDSFFVVKTGATEEFFMSFTGEIISSAEQEKIKNSDSKFEEDIKDAHSALLDISKHLHLESDQEDLAAINEILPWFYMNAITHFLTPHGLEQFGGAAWGTRDVTQGPFDLLMGMEKYSEARELLRIIFSNQEPDGGWPQWWMFDSYKNIRANGSHGDVYYWCIIALSNYIKITGDVQFLDEKLSYYKAQGTAGAEKTSLHEHMERLIQMIIDSFIPGTSFVPFGGGDWNDSLQPVSKDLAQRMISSWTVEMNYQAFSQYQFVYEQLGEKTKAKSFAEICSKIKDDFNKHLIKDGVVAGYGLVEPDGSISLLLHPLDTKTNIQYSILPMDRGVISGIFSKEQALHHQDLVEKYLKGPDGARLMDKPLRYKGGIQTIFQRAESSTFFGREIGLMYIHEHIRYAESLAITGKAVEFVKALRQANPVDYRKIVACGDIRQSNCYYSSSDVSFRNRYEADEKYEEIKSGKITLRGGWRVYSSGPGVYISLIFSRLLGLRLEFGKIIIDPVLPFSMDGLTASLHMMGHNISFKYSVKTDCYHPKSIKVNGTAIRFEVEENEYRKGGAVISSNKLLPLMNGFNNIIEVQL